MKTRLKNICIVLFLILAIIGMSGIMVPLFAEPTTSHRRLVWENPVALEPDLAGFWVYYAKKSEPEPRVYDNLRRVQLPTSALSPASEVLIIDIKPDITSGLCFKLTAYDTSNNESSFSNEACGWFGMSGPINLKGMP